MPETSDLQLGPYRLIGLQGPFFRDSQEVKLPPKALAVLWELTRQTGQVVTKAALLDAVWPETVVGEAVLAFQIQTLRQALGATLYSLGEFPSARTQLEQAWAKYDPQQRYTADALQGQEGVEFVLAYLAFTLWALGYADQARHCMQKAYEVVREGGSVYRMALVLGCDISLHQCLQDRSVARERNERLIQLAIPRGFGFWITWGKLVGGGSGADTDKPPGVTPDAAGGGETSGSWGAAGLAVPFELGGRCLPDGGPLGRRVEGGGGRARCGRTNG